MSTLEATGQHQNLLVPGSAVEVWIQLDKSWADGFEIADLTADGYVIRRHSDGATLPRHIPRRVGPGGLSHPERYGLGDEHRTRRRPGAVRRRRSRRHHHAQPPAPSQCHLGAHASPARRAVRRGRSPPRRPGRGADRCRQGLLRRPRHQGRDVRVGHRRRRRHRRHEPADPRPPDDRALRDGHPGHRSDQRRRRRLRPRPRARLRHPSGRRPRRGCSPASPSGASSPKVGGTWYLPRLLGWAKAAEISFLGRDLDAKESVEIGLANRMVDDQDLRGDRPGRGSRDRRQRAARDPGDEASVPPRHDRGLPEPHPSRVAPDDAAVRHRRLHRGHHQLRRAARTEFKGR